MSVIHSTEQKLKYKSDTWLNDSVKMNIQEVWSCSGWWSVQFGTFKMNLSANAYCWAAITEVTKVNKRKMKLNNKYKI